MRQAVAVGLLALLVLSMGSSRTAGSSSAEEQILLGLDREFDQATSAKGVEGWVVYFAEHGSMLPESGPPITGPEAIRKAMEPVLSGPENSLRWQPTRAEILIPGVLGYTVGRYQRKRTTAEAKTVIQRGTYVSLWRKQADGSWKIVLDTGSPDAPLTGAESSRLFH